MTHCQPHLAVRDEPEEGAPLRVSIHLGIHAIGPRPTKKNAHSRNARDARRLARIGRDLVAVPVSRASRGRRAPGGGHRDAGSDGRERVRERERRSERTGASETEGDRGAPTRALSRECSRAGNQCRFRGSGGHHAGRLHRLHRLHLYSTADGRFFFRGYR